MLKTQQWYQSLGLFSCYTCNRSWKNESGAVWPSDSASPSGDSTSPCLKSDEFDPTRRVCSCTRRVGPPDSIFSSFLARNGLGTLP